MIAAVTFMFSYMLSRCKSMFTLPCLRFDWPVSGSLWFYPWYWPFRLWKKSSAGNFGYHSFLDFVGSFGATLMLKFRLEWRLEVTFRLSGLHCSGTYILLMQMASPIYESL
ncbi:uncharacterized protein A4U43_C05F23470 [Asparagus officinalis]|uniref:Uncharacterized protein n=1 Tax=Asparagus officinalis TaxID=4686 RepID=A0A5P1ETW9_ASPOF|nr:uncharacterized protein A4U43_C05F23470 [Asparagus officinalis]